MVESTHHPATTGRTAICFLQVIEFHTSKIDEVRRLGDEWEAAAGPDRTAVRRTICQDRDDSSRFFNLVWFDSYESAMENSNLPVTQDFSQRMMALSDGEPTFYNLDVIEERDI
jgi:hypothetical protein